MADEQHRILIVEDSTVTARALSDMLAGQPDMTVVAAAPTGQEGVRRADELRPDVVLMDIHLPDIDGIQATWLIASKYPDTSIIMVTSEERIDYVQRAMMAGAQGYVVKPIRDPKELANTVREVRRHALDRRAKLTHPGADTHTGAVAPPRLGRRIAVFSSKGGQGKTTIAVNLAVMLRVLTDKSVLLMDTNLRFGEVNIFLDLPFGRSIVELLPRIDQLDSDLLTQVLVQHSSGVQVLMRPERPELAETVTGPDMEKVLAVLPRMFDYVVMDCEVSYDERLLAVLDRADTILLVLTPELGAVRNAQHFLELSQTLGYPQEKTLFVLNRAQSNVGLAPAEVERALGRRITFHLGSYGRLLATGLNMGKPLVLTQPRSEFTRRMREIAERVSKGADGTG